MSLFDDMLLGGAGLAFVEHEHTKHNRLRFEQQVYLQQQAAIQQQQGQQNRGQYEPASRSAPPQAAYYYGNGNGRARNVYGPQ